MALEIIEAFALGSGRRAPRDLGAPGRGAAARRRASSRAPTACGPWISPA